MNVQRFMQRIIEAWNADDNSQDYTLRIPKPEMQGTTQPFFYLKHKNSYDEFQISVRKLDPRESDPKLG